MAAMIGAKEIRFFLLDGMIQTVGFGSKVATDLRITVADGDTDNVDPERLEGDGYGDRCILSIITDGDSMADIPLDDEGVRWF